MHYLAFKVANYKIKLDIFKLNQLNNCFEVCFGLFLLICFIFHEKILIFTNQSINHFHYENHFLKLNFKIYTKMI